MAENETTQTAQAEAAVASREALKAVFADGEIITEQGMALLIESMAHVLEVAALADTVETLTERLAAAERQLAEIRALTEEEIGGAVAPAEAN